MRLEDCYYLGTITRTHGLQGHLVVKLDTDNPQAYNNLESVLADFNHVPVPFFIKQCSLLGNNALKIKFEDESIDVQKFIGIDLYLPLSSLPPLQGKQFYYHEIIGFDLQNENRWSAGKITAVHDNSPQVCFIIKTPEEKELYIPIINDWIIDVNRSERFISMTLPEGILDL
ncbi:MAG: ribosome maturation factor RimM [Flavobacteriaceae bacterium]|jgi:16S rRNA processing protein RimM|nr:ribosome maturation factor RimM [Flavobacteriaceae bacterium]